MLTRKIPRTGEPVPVIGCGTYIGFNVAPSNAMQGDLPAVMQCLHEAGGSVLDTSPMYDKAEATVGKLLDGLQMHASTFLATKVWTKGKAAGEAQMQRSMALMGTSTIDLMQVHNLVDYEVHLKTIRDWKEKGIVRYSGLTHYSSSAYRQLEQVLKAEDVDFVQFNYSVRDREAEQTLLPLAADLGVAVIVNMPFGSGGLLRELSHRAIPAWAADYECTTWSALLLKFILAHSAVTCVIPGTGSGKHMAENAAAGHGRPADNGFRLRLLAELDA